MRSIVFALRKKKNYPVFLYFLILVAFFSCTAAKTISKKTTEAFLSDSVFTNAFVGVAVYNPETKYYLFQHNSNKYFVPASNIKIPTLYAGLKYLGARLPGIKYAETKDTIYLIPTGDPSFLHPDYKQQPVFDFLEKVNKTIVITGENWKAEALGYGWAWDDYLNYYMTERSPLPVYGNCITWIQEKTIEQKNGKSDTGLLVFTNPEINWNVKFAEKKSPVFDVYRPRTENNYTITEGREMKRELEVPFVTNGMQAARELLKDTLHKEITAVSFETIKLPQQKILSQPADSLFKPLMHRSDNFFAEQVLMMVSNELLGYMDEQKLIDTLLKTDLKNFPQQPKWVDGSGLSRYNLFTPDDFVWLLNKMKDEFGMERLKGILPTGNEGTLRNYYKNESNFLFAKTGTLSGHVAFSGFLYTKKGKLLIFSILINNHYTSATAVRRAIEHFLRQIRNNYLFFITGQRKH